MPGAFKLHHLQPFEPILFWKFSSFFTFILGSHSLLPQTANYGSWENFPFPNMDETEGFQRMGQSNWTISSLLSLFCRGKFTTFPLSYWGAHSYYPRRPIIRKGNSPISKIGWDWGVSVPGAVKLDHLQPFKPILFWNFSNYFTFILGAHSYYPRGLILRVGRISQLPIWMTQRDFSDWDIQTGPFAAL